jgi:hypothetical protein
VINQRNIASHLITTNPQIKKASLKPCAARSSLNSELPFILLVHSICEKRLCQALHNYYRMCLSFWTQNCRMSFGLHLCFCSDNLLILTVVGDSQSGKTSLITRLVVSHTQYNHNALAFRQWWPWLFARISLIIIFFFFEICFLYASLCLCFS